MSVFSAWGCFPISIQSKKSDAEKLTVNIANGQIYLKLCQVCGLINETVAFLNS
jgi:hypothetical protein